MLTLPTEFDERRFHYSQVERTGNIAIYSQQKDDSHIVRFEVVIIRVEQGNTWPDGRTTPEREVYPPSRMWGKAGWTFHSLDAAKDWAARLQRDLEKEA